MCENIVVGKDTKYPLKGILTLPDNITEPVPAVVLVHGSGSSNMDEKVGKITPFKDLAEGLAKQGIACVRYNKRSFSYGFKMVMDKKNIVTVKEETIDDAIMAANLLKNDSRIDTSKVFIIGHSMGGMLAPRIDAEGGNFRGLIMMAGSPLPMEKIMLIQLEEQMSEMKGLTKKIISKQLDKFTALFEGLYELTDEAAKATKIGNGVTLYYFKEMGQPSVEDYLNKTDKPMLIMQGEKDFQVRADRDYAAYQKILVGRSNVTFKLYPGLNHAFVPATYEDISMAKKEYSIEKHIGDDVISDIANWIKSIN
ncbi:MAG: alpha/beta fold hydrolase [Oscillospiraceae bacterium]|nr:alpha/beta fold hydrolase [Oscillospiraceae bacterium]